MVTEACYLVNSQAVVLRSEYSFPLETMAMVYSVGMCSTKRNTVIAFKIWLMWHISVPFRRGWEWKD